jgi:hypothetical protein
LRLSKREFDFFCIKLMVEPEEVAFIDGGHCSSG